MKTICRTAWLAGFCLLLSACHGDYEQALEHLKAREYTEASRKFQDACDDGDKAACVAVKFARKHGTPYDLRKVLGEFRACEKEDYDSCFRLGLRYFQGDGLPADNREAYRLFRKICLAKKAPACVKVGKLGKSLFEKREFEKSGKAVKALVLLDMACNADHLTSCYQLGLLYKRGYGPIRIINKGNAIRGADMAIFGADGRDAVPLQKACRGGILAACDEL